MLGREYQGTMYWACNSIAAAIDGYNDYMDGELPGQVSGKMPINPSTANMWSQQVEKALAEHGKFPVGQ